MNGFAAGAMAATCAALGCWVIAAAAFVPLLFVFFPVTVACMVVLPVTCMLIPLWLLGSAAERYVS